MKKLFDNFAIEPTFYTNLKEITLPNFLQSQHGEGYLLGTASNWLENKLKDSPERKKHSWFKKAYEDGSNLEVPSPIYNNIKSFLEDYTKLVCIMKEDFNFLPSSIVDIEQEGGCHLNVSIPETIRKSKNADRFFNNLKVYLTNHPSIIWSFLSPTDDQSSVIPMRTCDPRYCTKGEFFTLRDSEGEGIYRSNTYLHDFERLNRLYPNSTFDKRNSRCYLSYKEAIRIELRFFMQPRTISEMKLEVDFGLHLLNWIWQQTIRGASYRYKNDKKSIKEYSENEHKTLKEIKKVCEEMEFPYERLVECGRIENLKNKFEYEPKYFV